MNFESILKIFKKGKNNPKVTMENIKEVEVNSFENTPKILNRHEVTEKLDKNKILNILGNSGVGKTIAQMMIGIDSINKGEQVIILDEEKEFINFVKKVGGEEYSLINKEEPDFDKQVILITIDTLKDKTACRCLIKNLKNHLINSKKFPNKKIIISEMEYIIRSQDIEEEMLEFLRVIEEVEDVAIILSDQWLSEMHLKESENEKELSYKDILTKGDTIILAPSRLIRWNEPILKRMFRGIDKLKELRGGFRSQGEGVYIRGDCIDEIVLVQFIAKEDEYWLFHSRIHE